MRRGVGVACAAAALLGFAWGPVLGLPADAVTAPAPAPSSSPAAAPSWARGLPACEYEDGSGGPVPCYWDGGSMGNGVGRSYIIRADGTTDYAAAGPAGEPFCQYDVYGHEIGVTGYGFRPGAKVAARVNGRTLRGKLGSGRPYGYTWRTRGSYTQLDVVVRVNGRVCEGT